MFFPGEIPEKNRSSTPIEALSARLLLRPFGRKRRDGTILMDMFQIMTEKSGAQP